MDTFRLLHIGDAHLQSAHPRNADRLLSLDQVITYGLTIDNLIAWLIPGDLFHTKPTTQDRNDLAPRLIRMAEKAPVVMVPGNHDEPGSLDIFARLEAMWGIFVADRPRVLRFETPLGQEVACFAMPYPFKAAMVAAGVEHQALGATTQALFDPIFMQAAADLADAVRAGALPVMIGHLSVGGAIASTGQPQIGTELEVSPAQLARLNVPAVGNLYQGLNHIHKHQTVGTAVYAGSIARLDFSEVEDKGFIEVEYQRDGTTWEHRWRFLPLPVPKMMHVEGRLTREAFLIDTIDGEPWPHVHGQRWDGIDVRCRYRFVKAEIGALDVAKVHAEFAGCRSLVLDPIAELEHSVRAPEIAAAVTLDAKVEAYAARQGLTLTDGLRAKLAALQGTDAERVLAQVTTQLASVGRPVPTPTSADLAEVQA